MHFITVTDNNPRNITIIEKTQGMNGWYAKIVYNKFLNTIVYEVFTPTGYSYCSGIVPDREEAISKIKTILF